jgi:hypothetical protein
VLSWLNSRSRAGDLVSRIWAAVEEVDVARVGVSREVLTRHPHRDIGEAILVEVADRDRCTEVVARLGDPGGAEDVLIEVHQGRHAADPQANCTLITGAIPRHSHYSVVDAVPIDIADRNGLTGAEQGRGGQTTGPTQRPKHDAVAAVCNGDRCGDQKFAKPSPLRSPDDSARPYRSSGRSWSSG